MPFARSNKSDEAPTVLQVWIDRLRFVLGVVAIIAIAVTFAVGQSQKEDINNRITKIESPCLRYGPNSRQCRATFSAAISSITDYQLCILLSQRPDLTGVNPATCRRIAREAHRKAAAERHNGTATAPSDGPFFLPVNPSPENGDGKSNPSPPSPSPNQPRPPKHHPAPSPAPTPAPAPEPAPGNSGESPGHTGENPGQGGGPGAGVERRTGCSSRRGSAATPGTGLCTGSSQRELQTLNRRVTLPAFARAAILTKAPTAQSAV